MATRAEGARRLAWTEVRVDVPRGWHEVVAEALIFGPCTSVTLGTTSLAARQPEAQWLFRADWQNHNYQARLRG